VAVPAAGYPGELGQDVLRLGAVQGADQPEQSVPSTALGADALQQLVDQGRDTQASARVSRCSRVRRQRPAVRVIRPWAARSAAAP
jgi:hypothetical protein